MNEVQLKELLLLLPQKELNEHEVREACKMLFDDQVHFMAKAEFLRALHRRKETPGEMARFAEVLLEKSINPLPTSQHLPGPILEICGTGGDRSGLFNVSTTVMFVAAACGAIVVKIGNRAATSASGGADVLEALDVNLFLSPKKIPATLEASGCVFLFAPAYYPILRSISTTRRFLAKEGSPTLFNFLGPLLNPIRPPYQLVGLFEPTLINDYANILDLLGRKSAWVVCGEAGSMGKMVDEVSTLGWTSVCSLQQGKKKNFQIHPDQFGLSIVHLEDLRGGDTRENARILVDILNGSDRGPRRDIVLANTAAALCVCGIAADLSQGITLASEALSSGEALRRLHTLVKLSQ